MSQIENSKSRLIRLDSWAALKICGEDAEAFLQGQISADIRALRAESAVLTSYSSPKGRVLALPLMMRIADGFELWLPRSLLDVVSKRLRMFVLRSKVNIEQSDSQALGLLGQSADFPFAAQLSSIPVPPLEVTQADSGLRIMRAYGEAARYFICGSPENLTSLESESDQDLWRRAEITAGVPIVVPETQDKWVAQMLNIDRFAGGIDFKKGCYTGQEVIARLHYLGKLKKRMFVIHGEGEPPAPGTAIHDPTGDGQAVGDIVDAIAANDGKGFIACAVLQVAVARTTGLCINQEPARRISSIASEPAQP